MLISLNWLNEYISIKDKSISELENALTMIGQEVEKIDNKYEHLDKVLTAKIVDYKKHENSDHLTVCMVDNGTEVLQVVCGATNHKLGDIVAMAQVGAKLSENFEIKKGKIRGEESNGMLCSYKELDLGEEDGGIIIFPEDTPLGVPLNKLLDKDDIVFELEITPNRPDCLSYIGIARELSAYYNLELKKPSVNLIENDKNNDTIVEIEDENLSKKYITRVIENVKVTESPKWLKDKIEAMGMKSINNIVDISNFVLFEQNQPNHIFDLDKISSNIVVRNAKDKEKITTLDDKELELCSEDIVISSNDKAVALAGVMGSKDYSVNSDTKNILLEVAHFNPMSIRKTSRRYAIISDSSYRFERRVDIANQEYVIDRLAELIVSVAGGEVLKGINGKTFEYDKPKTVKLRLDRMERFIGKHIPKEIVIGILKGLEINIEDNGNELLLTAPTFRMDLADEQDYFEEIIRMYGFDNIENILPKLNIKEEKVLDTTAINYTIKKICVMLGLREVINYSFIPKKSFEMTKTEYTGAVEIENPIIEDFAVLRKNLMYSLIKNVVDNFNRSFTNLRFFELSRVFNNLEETTKLGIILAGKKPKNIYAQQEKYDFADIKGILELLLDELGVNNYRVVRSNDDSFHPGISADIFIGKDLIASLGSIHPDVLENFKLEKDSILYLELNIDLLKKYIRKNIKYQALSKYQSTTRDLALIVKKDILVGNVVKSISKLDKLIQSIEVFDVYEGVGIPEGYKSFAVTMLLRADDRTLAEEEINNVVNKIIDKLQKEYQAEVRK